MNDKLSYETTEHYLKGIRIPAQPKILLELEQESGKSDVSLNRITEIIIKDIGISGAVIKVINSPMFGLKSKVISIKQALNLLGFENVLNIIRCLSLRNAFANSQNNSLALDILNNSTKVAMSCMAISRTIGIGSINEAYSLGLFHDSGIILLMDKFTNYIDVFHEAYANPDIPISDAESAAINTNHAIVGYYIAKSWNLPEHISQVIADHHKTDSIFSGKTIYNEESKKLLAILKISENTCSTFKNLGNSTTDHEFARIKRDILDYIEFSESDFDDLQSWIREIQSQDS